MTARSTAAPRMIAYGYPNCISCHVSVQGRGLLNSYGRGIDIAQSYSKKDLTALLLGRAGNQNDAAGNWDGRFGNLLFDFYVTSRLNHRIDPEKTDPTLLALYRQVIFFDHEDRFRLNTEVGFQDSGLADIRLGPNLTATGGDLLFLKKLTIEWRLENNGTTSGKEIALGRDYLPLGVQIDDYTTFILHLNRDGIYDFPLQLKYFVWNEKSLAAAYLHAPSFQEPVRSREYGGGLLYERYPTEMLAVGMQALIGFRDESDRFRIGPYARWGISNKWAILAQADFTSFWDGHRSSGAAGSQVTGYLQLYYHHYEWLVSSITANYAYSDYLSEKEHLSSFRLTTSARVVRNLNVGLTYGIGDIERDLGNAQELAIFATIKF
ncbi:MAG TPA: hypothetical protein VJ719_11525 [Chthoniobacterales bacterium]|nr:hypothetical protein [Chthoniobacterales bacterium]